jgi:hypothetical protein
MSYTPLTDAFYLAMAGFDAAQAAGGRPVTSSEEAMYSRQGTAAFAFAEEFDTQWGDTPPDYLETAMIAPTCLAYWRDRDDGSDVPAHYAQAVAEIIAIILEADAIAVAGGATPPPGPGSSAVASGWGTGDSSFDTAGEVLSTVTLTPLSTGKLHCECNTSLVINAGDAEVIGSLYITIGADNVDPTESPIIILFEVPSGQSSFPSFTVDLDRGSPEFTAPVGSPVIVNLCGKTGSGTLSGVSTLSVQERSE